MHKGLATNEFFHTSYSYQKQPHNKTVSKLSISIPNVRFVRRDETSRKLGLLAGFWCQHAIIILWTVGGYRTGISNFTPLIILHSNSLKFSPYGLAPGFFVSHRMTPKLQTSDAGENSLSSKLSGAIQRTGNKQLDVDTYGVASLGISLRRPKSPTLHISFFPTITLQAARSYWNHIIIFLIQWKSIH